jgi:hypothetical protein
MSRHAVNASNVSSSTYAGEGEAQEAACGSRIVLVGDGDGVGQETWARQQRGMA